MGTVRIYLCALSDPIRDQKKYELWKPAFEQAGITVELSRLLRQEVSARLKADDFNKALRSGRYAWIIDVSGGDLANTVLPYLDYEAYALSNTYYAAFSDGTCIVNALAARSGRRALLFPIWNQTSPQALIQIITSHISPVHIEPLAASGPWPRHARVYGGNIRCFLKLAGTGMMPDPAGSMMVLESSGATWYSFSSMASHLEQTGVLDQIRGFVLGRFNVLERELGSRKAAVEKIRRLLDSLCARQLAFYDAPDLGHIPDSQGLWISAGKPYVPLNWAEYDLQKESSAPIGQLAVANASGKPVSKIAALANPGLPGGKVSALENHPGGGVNLQKPQSVHANLHEGETVLAAAAFLKFPHSEVDLEDTLEFEKISKGKR